MSEVKIYTVVSDELSPPVIGESFCTDMVRHSDYAALEQKLTDMAVQLANAESKCRELAAEVQAVRWACGQVYMKGYNHGHLNTVDGIEYASDTELVERGGETLAYFTDPDHCGVAADAILAEVRASGIDEMAVEYRKFANKDGCSCNMQSSYNLTAERAESYAAYIRRKGAAL